MKEERRVEGGGGEWGGWGGRGGMGGGWGGEGEGGGGEGDMGARTEGGGVEEAGRCAGTEAGGKTSAVKSKVRDVGRHNGARRVRGGVQECGAVRDEMAARTEGEGVQIGRAGGRERVEI